MLRAKFVLLPLLCALPISSETASQYDRFEFFNDCRPMWFRIKILDNDNTLHRDAHSALRAMGKSRLQSAGLYSENTLKTDFSLLEVSVLLFGPSYVVDARYKKNVTDKNGETFPAPTWQNFRWGTSEDALYIFIESSLSGILDDFLAEYLRVNEAACESR